MMSYYSSQEGAVPPIVPAQEAGAQQLTELAWLDILQQQMITYLASRVRAQELAIFRFCLRQLFLCFDALHRLDLSDPAHGHADLTTSHLDWQQLVSLTGIIERIESLCQLLQGALLSLLDGLDAPPHALPSTPLESGEARASIPGHQEPSSTAHDQWNDAYTALAERLETWQLSEIRHVSFLERFSPLVPLISALPQVDDALATLREHALAIFGDILLDFQAVSSGDEEAAATLLLDIAQKADQILASCDTLLDALPTLVQQHAPGIGMS